MEIVRMYKEMDVKFEEFDAALRQLGYSKSTDEKFIVYNHKMSEHKIFLSHYHSELKYINKGWFVANADNMTWFGVINHRDDLAKMIEQMRLEELSEAV
jgi:hypothetical protein